MPPATSRCSSAGLRQATRWSGRRRRDLWDRVRRPQMIAWLVAHALKLRVIVVLLAALLVILGLPALRNSPLDVFPEFAPPLVEVQTEAPGLAPEEVESLITMPLENALNGMPGVKTIRSKSVLGLSSVVLIFDEGTDLLQARQLVQERLAVEAPQLPAVAHPPVILPPLSSTSRVLKIGMSSQTLVADGDDHARALDDPAAADGDPRRRERRASGASATTAPGAGRPRPAAPRTGVTLDDVVAAPRRDASSRPAAGSSTRPTSGSPSAHRVASSEPPRTSAEATVAFRAGARPAARRRRRRRRGAPAADRRRGHQRRPRACC